MIANATIAPKTQNNNHHPDGTVSLLRHPQKEEQEVQENGNIAEQSVMSPQSADGPAVSLSGNPQPKIALTPNPVQTDPIAVSPPVAIQMKPEETGEEEKIDMKPESSGFLAMATGDAGEGNEEEDQKAIQLKPVTGKSHVSPHLETQIHQTKGNGQPLPKEVAGEMSNKIGADFSQVNVHTDSQAVQMNKELGAKAFAHGQDVYFNQGQYNLESREGKKLLAHELVHTVQQSKTRKMVLLQSSDKQWTKDYYYKTLGEAKVRIQKLKDKGKEARYEKINVKGKVRYRVLIKSNIANNSTTQTKSVNQVLSYKGLEAGDTKSTKIIYVSWTLDDGPTKKHIEKLRVRKFIRGSGKNRKVMHTTWYVMRNKIKNVKDYKYLKNIQKEGHEIGIHSFHPTADHAAWFPALKKYASKWVSYPYRSVSRAMSDLQSFTSELRKYVKVKFVRLPGGLLSELMYYLNTLERSKKRNARKLAKIISSGRAIENSRIIKLGFKPANVNKVIRDYGKVKSKLKTLGLHLWGGRSKSEILKLGEIQPQSWQTEAKASGVRHAVKKFKSKVDMLAASKNRVAYGSLVILTHDTSNKYIKSIESDIDKMERYAVRKKVKIVYTSMSELYNKIAK